MSKIVLTDLTVKSLKAEKRTDFWDAKLPSFGIRVGPRSKTFIVKIGNSRRTIGTYPAISLQDARRAAQIEKVTPTAPLASSPTTFQDAYDLFTVMHIRRKKNTTQDNYKGYLNRNFLKPFSQKTLDEITNRDIITITDKLTPSNQAYALSVIRIFWNFCRRRQLTKNNPVDTVRVQQSPSRDRVLSDDELKAIWKTTEEPTTYHYIVRMLLLTGQRRGEIVALQKTWIKANEIVFPKEITKNGKEHTIPLGSLSLAILTSTTTMGPTQKLLFPAKSSGNLQTSFNGWSKSKLVLDKKLGNNFTPWTLHDLRRTFATNMAKLGVRLEVTEKLLNHISGSLGGIVAVYQKHNFQKEMTEAVELWEKRLIEIVGQ